VPVLSKIAVRQVAIVSSTTGLFTMMPRRAHHWGMATAPFIIQIQAMGPFDIHYINPAEDPTRGAKR